MTRVNLRVSPGFPFPFLHSFFLPSLSSFMPMVFPMLLSVAAIVAVEMRARERENSRTKRLIPRDYLSLRSDKKCEIKMSYG